MAPGECATRFERATYEDQKGPENHESEWSMPSFEARQREDQYHHQAEADDQTMIDDRLDNIANSSTAFYFGCMKYLFSEAAQDHKDKQVGHIVGTFIPKRNWCSSTKLHQPQRSMFRRPVKGQCRVLPSTGARRPL